MKIVVNGEPADVVAATLADALFELGFADAKVATALNEAFVAKDARAACALSDGDRLEILAPMQGG
ncbi:MAG: sulfur carrier protein ThiS [Pseudomonadota bacterium]